MNPTSSAQGEENEAQPSWVEMIKKVNYISQPENQATGCF